MNSRFDFRRRDDFVWSPARISQMCEMHGAGTTYSTIASALGCSRSAGIGKFNRLSFEAGRAGLTKGIVAELLAEDEGIGSIARRWGVTAGAVEARLAEIRRDLGPQAI